MVLLRSACTGNLVVAIALVWLYVLYGLLAGLPIDQYFLGVSGPWRLGRGGGHILPGWAFDASLGMIILTTLVVGRSAGWNMRGHRVFCGVFGVLFLTAACLPQGIVPSAGAVVPPVPAGIPSFDHVLATYVSASYLAYALVGPNDNRSTLD
jgi:hypothetical protein